MSRSYWGVRVSFKSNSKPLFEVLTRLLPGSEGIDASAPAQVTFALIERTSEDDLCDFLVNGKRIYSDFPSDSYFQLIERYLQEALAILSHHFVWVHAGVVGWCGRAIILPGKSCTGKTTLVMALVKAGAVFYSDEYAIFDQNARVHAFVRPPKVRSQADCEAAKCLNDRLGMGIGAPESLPVGLILLSSYSENATWQLEELTPRESVFGLMENTLAIRYHPEVSLRVLKEVSLRSRSYRTLRGDADAVANQVLAVALNGGAESRSEAACGESSGA